jgi:hypothetical protein
MPESLSYSNLPATRNVPPALVAVSGWLLPGAGYLVLGGRENRIRGIIVGVTILALFLLGILIGGIRVIDVPGYDRLGGQVRIEEINGRSTGRRIDTTSVPPSPAYNTSPPALMGRGFFGELANKPWYVGQILTGPICLAASWVSLSVARQGIPQAHARLNEIGTLYAAVAGMLNLLAIIDSAHRAAHPHHGEAPSTTAPSPAPSVAGGGA